MNDFWEKFNRKEKFIIINFSIAIIFFLCGFSKIVSIYDETIFYKKINKIFEINHYNKCDNMGPFDFGALYKLKK